MTVKVRVTTTYTHSVVIDAPDDFDVNGDELTAAELWKMRRGVELTDLDHTYRVEYA